MKTRQACLLALGLLLSNLASAVTVVTVNNFQFPATPENGVTLLSEDYSGTPRNHVPFALGTYSGGILSDTYSRQGGILDNFTVLALGNTGPGFHFTTQVEILDSPQDNSPIYLLFGSCEEFSTSNYFTIFQGNGNYVVEDEIFGGVSSVQLQNSILLSGTETPSNGAGVVGPFVNFNNGVISGPLTKLEPLCIPEPSSSLLLALGSLGLSIRRKR